MMVESSSTEYSQLLAEVFTAYKQERMGPDMFDLFVTPGYFPELKARTPCVVIGGRGTGKTTALWGLSYEGTFARSGESADCFEDSEIIGVYLKCDRAVAQTFSGASRPADDWSKLFVHYINLSFSLLVVDFVVWAQEQETTVSPVLNPRSLDEMFAALGDPTPPGVDSDLTETQARLRRLITDLELAVNNNKAMTDLTLSVLGRPFQGLVDSITASCGDRAMAFLLDEYESFSAAQQQVVNTLVKNADHSYTVKVAVRELGFHSRDIVGGGESLVSPADYSVIDLSRRLTGSRFAEFASQVVDARIREFNRRLGDSSGALPAVGQLFPGLSLAEEAHRLGAKDVADRVRGELSALSVPEAAHAFVANASDIELVILRYWAESDRIPLATAAATAAGNSRKWENRLVNYGYASLFTLRSQRAVRIRKYYAGWETFVLLASGNIRFLLLLVSSSLLRAHDANELGGHVPAETQTLAAQDVGQGHLLEIRDIDHVGADLLRLALGLGRLFETMARDPYGHTPEVNEFYLSPADVEQIDSERRERLEDLLRAAVQHSVVLRLPSSKRRDALTTREDDYLLHPILSAVFVFTHRRKRKILLTPADVLGLVSAPRESLREILRRTGRELVDETDFLPEQIRLFDSYFSAHDEPGPP